jgi:hypothetical protein
VGYGRPPVATRLKPGQSGKPCGRPKSRRSSAEDFLQETAAFPNGAHDDQVDALSQALGWITQRSRRSGLSWASIPLY